MIGTILALTISAGPAPVSDPTLALLAPIAAKAGLAFEGDCAMPDRSTDFDGDGRNDTVVLMTRTVDGALWPEHHAYFVGTRGWRGWLAWGSVDYFLVSRGVAWVFCFAGSGSGQGCSTVEFSSGRARVLKEESGNAEWSLRCDYSEGLCTRCEPCELEDEQSPRFSRRRVARWSATLPNDVAWTGVDSPAALLSWLEHQGTRSSAH